jgi:hypothetical protein
MPMIWRPLAEMAACRYQSADETYEDDVPAAGELSRPGTVTPGESEL